MGMDVAMDPNEVLEKGSKIYETQRAKFEAEHMGEFVAIEVTSGDVYFGETTTEAILAAEKKYPDAIFYVAQVGVTPKSYRMLLNFSTSSNDTNAL